MANPNPKHKFSSTNQPPAKARTYRNVLLEALKKSNKPMSEVEFVTYYVNEAMESEPVQASAMLREIFLRINPVPKPVAPPVEFEFPSNGSALDKVNAIISGVASGLIPTDLGKSMVDMIKVGLDVLEVTELAVRLEKLERLLEQRDKE